MSLPKLRKQIKEIGERRVNKAFVDQFDDRIPLMLTPLIYKAFVEQWGGHDVLVLRHAAKMLDARGFISVDEPALEPRPRGHGLANDIYE